MLKKIIIILSIFYICQSFLVYETIPISKYEIKMKTELKNIVNLHGLEEMKYKDYVFEKDSKLYKLMSIKHEGVFFNPNLLSMIVNTKDPLSIGYNWEAPKDIQKYISPYHCVFSAMIGETIAEDLDPEKLYDIQFTVDVSNFKFTKSWKINEDINNLVLPEGNAEMEFISLTVNYKNDGKVEYPYPEAFVLEIINGFLKSNEAAMNEAFNIKNIQSYYLSIPFEKAYQKIYTQTSSEITNENTINFYYDAVPTLTSDNNVLIKRKGELNDIKIESSEILKTENQQETVYINKNIIYKIISENLFSMKIEQTNNPAVSYKLDVTHLKQIIDVPSGYNDTSEFSLAIEIQNTTFNKENTGINGVAKLKVDVICRDDFETIFTFNINIKFSLNDIYFHNGINFLLLSKNMSIDTITPEEGKTIKDEEILRNWIEETYKLALSNNEFNIFANSIDLSDSFNNNDAKVNYDGDYIVISK